MTVAPLELHGGAVGAALPLPEAIFSENQCGRQRCALVAH